MGRGEVLVEELLSRKHQALKITKEERGRRREERKAPKRSFYKLRENQNVVCRSVCIYGFLPLTSFVSLGKLLKLSVPQTPLVIITYRM